LSVELSYEPANRDLFILTLSDRLKWDDFYTALDYGYSYPRAAEAPYDVIVDASSIEHFSPDAIYQLRRAASLSEQNEGKIVLVTPSAYAATLFSVFQRIYPKVAHKYALVKSLADARAAVGATTLLTQ
jgi:anti-anti-sigma regulatory factor